MLENENTSVSVEVADPQTTEATDTGVSNVQTAEQAVEQVETAKPQQSAEENAKYAEMRRKQELDSLRSQYKDKETAYTNLEKESNSFKDKVKNILGNFVTADSVDDMLIALEAQAKGISERDLRTQMQIEQNKLEEQKKINDELDYYKGIADKYQREQSERMIAEDLQALQVFDPNIKSLDDLGEEFVTLRFTTNPLTGEFYTIEELYNHFKSKIKPLPQSSGRVQTVEKAKPDSEFLTSEEVDKLTDEDYDKTPGLLEKVRRSMAKW